MKVKLLRIEKGYGQKEFADMVGITPQYLRQVEIGKADIRRSLMIKIAKALDTTVQELFFSEEE
ncbi:helix-turn-helix transcriptional regulator [Clostridium sp.]|uniref:helix-turn-helix transcriptional regulator n=1 Tax=Clostridium sp. TaxID=1506 RepID=UPI00399626DD